jgi:2-amino-4-hydroxy-6-hydroxymethyldihydropteridine diphosphokinase
LTARKLKLRQRTTSTRNDRAVALALGSNTPDAVVTLRCAADLLLEFLADARLAPLYRSLAQSPISQDDYLNTAVVGVSSLLPQDLLAFTKRLEWLAGRRRAPRLSPRALDIDVLLVEGVVSLKPELTLPHPRLAQRRFVLAPLADLEPDWCVPGHEETVAALLAKVGHPESVWRVAWH